MCFLWNYPTNLAMQLCNLGFSMVEGESGGGDEEDEAWFGSSRFG